LPPAHQRLYSRLLQKNSQGAITVPEKKKLHALGEEARRLTLKKAHAYMLLKWRGHYIPSPEELLARRVTKAAMTRTRIPRSLRQSRFAPKCPDLCPDYGCPRSPTGCSIYCQLTHPKERAIDFVVNAAMEGDERYA
jgi:hypothetical protein